MRRTISRGALRWALSILVVVSGCSTPKLAKLEIPDGRHRRPANPYGTVLPSVDAVAGTVVAPVRPAALHPLNVGEPTMMFPTPGPTMPATRPEAQVPALDTVPDTKAPTDPMEK
jgi:hypothetical protein